MWPYVKQLRQWVKQCRRQGGAAAAGRAAAAQAPAEPGLAPKQQGHRAEPVQEGAVTTHVQVSECNEKVHCPALIQRKTGAESAWRNGAVIMAGRLPLPWCRASLHALPGRLSHGRK